MHKVICVVLLVLLSFPTISISGEIYPWDLIKDAKFEKTYHKALGEEGDDDWIWDLSGPSTPIKKIKIENDEYYLLHSCKPHDCDIYNIVIIYNEDKNVAYGKIQKENLFIIFGNPSDALKGEINHLYSEQF